MPSSTWSCRHTCARSARSSACCLPATVKLAFSSGKDSSACANLMSNAAIAIAAAGYKCSLLVVSHANTGIESPVVRAIADGELEKMRAFARAHDIPLEIHVARPTLSASFATRIIGGRALPSFPQECGGCS